MENPQIPQVGTRSIREGTEAERSGLWYGDDKSPIFINLLNASRLRMTGSMIRVYHGREFVDIDCTDENRCRFLFSSIVQHLLETSKVLSQPREMTKEEKDEIQKNALANGNKAVSGSQGVRETDTETSKAAIRGAVKVGEAAATDEALPIITAPTTVAGPYCETGKESVEGTPELKVVK